MSGFVEEYQGHCNGMDIGAWNSYAIYMSFWIRENVISFSTWCKRIYLLTCFYLLVYNLHVVQKRVVRVNAGFWDSVVKNVLKVEHVALQVFAHVTKYYYDV